MAAPIPAAVLFDLDGCLVDSEVLSLTALIETMREAGLPGQRMEIVRARFLGMALAEIRGVIEKDAGRAMPVDFAKQFHDRLYASYATGLDRIEGMVAAADALAARGIAVAIASGGSRARIGHTLDLAGLRERFDGRAFSAEDVANGKPAPDLVRHAAKALGVPPAACVVIEDAPHGITGAVAAGMRAIGFVGASHLEGMRDEQARLLRRAGAEAVARAPSDVLRLILEPGRPAP